MSGLLTKFSRVSSALPCPVCGKPDWCLVSYDGTRCICARTPSQERYGEAGWVHEVIVDVPADRRAGPREHLSASEINEFLIKVGGHDDMIAYQAEKLGLNSKALQHVQAGYEVSSATLTFPMFDADGEPCGVRLRRGDGRKWSLKGGREGIFRPRFLDVKKTLFVTEGPTDAAAAAYLGLENVIGRPNRCGGRRIILEMVRRVQFWPVVIISDPDYAGQCDAVALAKSLPPTNPCVVIVGRQDLRDLVVAYKLKQGNSHAIIEALERGNKLFKRIFRNHARQLNCC